MKDIFLLTKILLKSSMSDNGTKKKAKLDGIGRIITLIAVYGYIVGFMTVTSYFVLKGLMAVNQPELFLKLSLILFVGFGIVQTVITSLNILYFSKDLEVLLPLPITPIKLIIAKLNCLVFSQYMIAAFLVLPGVIVYGVLLKLDITYYIVAVFNLLLFPLLPVALISLLVTLVMKFTKIIKNKEMLQYVAVILTLVLIVAITGVSGTNSTNEEFVNGLIQNNETIEKISKLVPTINLTINSILNHNNISGIISVGLITSISVGIYYIAAFIISKIYIKTVVSLVTIKNKVSKTIENLDSLKSNNICVAYLTKEFRLLLRNPIFFMQCVLPSVIFPIIITVPAFMEIKSTTANINSLQTDFSNIINTSFGFMCLMIAILVFFIFNYTSITAVSRDGQNAVFMKYVPISLRKQLIYKVLPGVVLNCLPVLYFLIFLILCIPGLKVKTMLYFLIVATLINILNNILMIIVDLRNPKLKWISEQAVVKQNFNMFFSMAFIGIEAVLILILGMFCINLDLAAILLITLFTLMLIFIEKYIKHNEEKIFNKII